MLRFDNVFSQFDPLLSQTFIPTLPLYLFMSFKTRRKKESKNLSERDIDTAASRKGEGTQGKMSPAKILISRGIKCSKHGTYPYRVMLL